MHWVHMIGGTALYLNNTLIGWVTSTLNGQYFYGLVVQSTRQKQTASTKHNAMLRLLNSVGD